MRSKNNQKESMAEAELDEEIRGLQAGDGRRGSNASQSNGCGMDPTFLHSFFTSGADLARQQLMFPKSECGKTHGAQHQQAMSPQEKEEKKMRRKRRRAMSRQMGKPACRNEWFPTGSVFDSSMPSKEYK